MILKNRLFIASFFSVPALEAILAVFWLTSTSSDAQTALFAGLSASRLIIAGGLLVAATALFFLAVLSWRKPESVGDWLEAKLNQPKLINTFALGFGGLFLAASAVWNIPVDYLGKLWAIEERLRPLTLWVSLASFQFFLGCLGWQLYQPERRKTFTRNHLLSTLITLGIFSGIWALIYLTRLGLTGGNSYWSKVGVPLLWPQIFLSLLVGLGLSFLLSRLARLPKLLWLDVGLCLLLWLIAAWLWQGQAYQPGVSNSPPRPPTEQIFPTNDSQVFDLAAQKMLIGRSMPGETHDKPIYIVHLAFLHLLAGQNFSLFYLLQIFSFAFIPICGYWLGKNLHSRPAGLFFASLLILKEQNAIALTNYISVSTSKLILSELLTSLGLLIFALVLIRWLRAPQLSNAALWLAGGLLGLISLVRLNAISVLPTTLLVIGLALKFKFKKWALASLIFTACLLLSALPWLTRNLVTAGDPLNFIRTKTDGVVINQRYKPVIEQAHPATPGDPAATTPKPADAKLNSYLTLAKGVTTNYLHNLIGVTLMLPPSFELYRLEDLVRLPYWRTEWEGNLLPGAFWIILVVLALAAQGFASAWKRWRAAALVPFAILFGYNLTTAVSLTSGGRYLVPFDWVFLFYFSLGLFNAAAWLLSLFGWSQPAETLPEPASKPKTGVAYRPILLVSLGLLMLGASPVLLENLPRERYPVTVNLEEFKRANQTLPALFDPEIAAKIQELGQDPLFSVLYGRALYPRYYGENKGDAPWLEIDPLIGATNFDRTTFLLLDDLYETHVLFPSMARPSPKSSGADTWVLGCQRGNYLEARLMVMRNEGWEKVYWQEDFPSTCQQLPE